MLKTFRYIPLMLLAFVLSLPLTAHAEESELKDAASASTDDSRILEMMGDTHYWDQVEGRYTADPEDDQFEIKNY